MDILRQAFQAVQRNLQALAVYLVITVGANVVALMGNHAMDVPEEASHWGARLWVYELAVNVFLVAAYSAAQSVAFSRLGKEIDRPLWKISGDREALGRYFVLWVVLNAVLVLVKELAVGIPILLDNEQFGAPFRWLLALTVVLSTPVGACVMFTRNFEWRRLGESLRPLRRQLPATLLVLLLNGLVFFLALNLMFQTKSQQGLWPLIDVIAGYFDCVVFSAIWLICMLDRATPEDVELDF